MNACVPFSFKLQGDIELSSVRLGNVFVYLVKCELISVDKLIRKPHWSNKIKKGDLINFFYAIRLYFIPLTDLG